MLAGMGSFMKSIVTIYCVVLSFTSTAAKPLRFVAMGDWGEGDVGQGEVAIAMGNWAATRNPDFILSLGDNFYPTGVQSINDTQWDTKWKQMYMNQESLQVPWHVMAGNHDHYGNVTAEIEFSQVEPLWVFPSLYYTFSAVAGNATVDIIVYDTQTIKKDNVQQDWLFDTISNSKADWLIVTAHAPVYSSGLHGMSFEVAWVENNLRPVLEENNVAFYLSGHDHDQQHIIKEGTPVDYVITGGGHDFRYRNPIALWQLEQKGASLVWRAPSLGFTEFEIEDDTATVQFINEDGEVIYSFTKSNPNIE